MKPILLAGLAGLGAAALIAACAPEDRPTSARNDFASYCVDCHGPGGKGDGPVAEGLTPRPADLTGIAARNGGSFPKAAVMSHIYGYTMGRSDSPMPEFGDLLEGRTVMYDSGDGVPTPTPWRLVALAEYLENLQQP